MLTSLSWAFLLSHSLYTGGRPLPRFLTAGRRPWSLGCGVISSVCVALWSAVGKSWTSKLGVSCRLTPSDEQSSVVSTVLGSVSQSRNNNAIKQLSRPKNSFQSKQLHPLRLLFKQVSLNAKLSKCTPLLQNLAYTLLPTSKLLGFNSVIHFTSRMFYRCHTVSCIWTFALTFYFTLKKDSLLTSDLAHLLSNADLRDEYLCQVSFKSLH